MSNLAQSHNAGTLSVARRWSQAIGFTTGSRSGGYTLSHLETIITEVSGDGLLVSLYDEAAGGGPGTRQFDFTNPDELTANALAAFMAPADTTLAADTRYFVVYAKTGLGTHHVSATRQTSEDGGASPGWSIDDRRYVLRNYDKDGWDLMVNPFLPRFALNPLGATADTTAPALVTASIDGTSLVLTYDEALDEDSVPAAARLRRERGRRRCDCACERRRCRLGGHADARDRDHRRADGDGLLHRAVRRPRAGRGRQRRRGPDEPVRDQPQHRALWRKAADLRLRR